MKKRIASGVMAFVLAASANGYLLSAGYDTTIFAEETETEASETAKLTDEQMLVHGKVFTQVTPEAAVTMSRERSL